MKKDISWLAESFYNNMYQNCSEDTIREANSHIESARVGDVFVEYGRISSRYTNEQKRTIRVLIIVPEVPDPMWYKLYASLSSHPYVLSRVLAGAMPREVAEIFTEVGLSLVPEIDSFKVTVDDEQADLTDSRVLAVLEKFVTELMSEPYLLCKLLGRSYTDIEKGLRDMLMEQGLFSKKNAKSIDPVKVSPEKLFLGESISEEIIVKADELPASLLRRLDYLFPELSGSQVDKNMELAYERVSRLAQSLARFM